MYFVNGHMRHSIVLFYQQPSPSQFPFSNRVPHHQLGQLNRPGQWTHHFPKGVPAIAGIVWAHGGGRALGRDGGRRRGGAGAAKVHRVLGRRGSKRDARHPDAAFCRPVQGRRGRLLLLLLVRQVGSGRDGPRPGCSPCWWRRSTASVQLLVVPEALDEVVLGAGHGQAPHLQLGLQLGHLGRGGRRGREGGGNGVKRRGLNELSVFYRRRGGGPIVRCSLSVSM